MGSSWALHSDAFLVEVDADEVEGGALLPSTSARAWRLCTALEVQMGALSSPLSGRVELGLRFDGGDAAYDGGVEVGGSLAYVNPDAGIEVQLRGRWMTSLQSTRADERGVSLNLTYDAGMMNRGWMLTASPEWGETSTGTGSLWDSVESLGAVGVGGLRAGEPALRLPPRSRSRHRRRQRSQKRLPNHARRTRRCARKGPQVPKIAFATRSV